MSRQMVFLGFMVAAFATIVYTASAQDSFTVLDNQGWTVPTSGGDSVYRNWAAGKEFEVGDTLVFNFTATRHNVAEVPKAYYDACNGTGEIFVNETGPAIITLRSTGAHYYICTVPGHCQGGQKLAITVKNSTDTPDTPDTPSPTTPPNTPSPTTPPNTPSPTTPSPPPPPKSPASSSVAAGGFVVTLLATAVAFLY